MAASGLDLRYAGQNNDTDNSIMRERELLRKTYCHLALTDYANISNSYASTTISGLIPQGKSRRDLC